MAGAQTWILPSIIGSGKRVGMPGKGRGASPDLTFAPRAREGAPDGEGGCCLSTLSGAPMAGLPSEPLPEEEGVLYEPNESLSNAAISC